jgi:hypothetical protein
VKPLSINLFPLSFEGEGDKGGEVNKHSQAGYLLLWWVFIIIYGMSQRWGVLFCVVRGLEIATLRSQ